MRTQLSLVLLLCLTGRPAFGEPLLLPIPPEQQSPWSAPDTVPTNLLSAVTTLFAQGFPDPRGCEFRHLTVQVSSVWGEPRGFRGGTTLDQETKAQSAPTTGWLLPVSGSQTQQFAICWNGLIYPVGELGSPADLSAEAAKPPRAVGRSPYYFGGGEIRSVFSTNAGSSRLLLLLRSGETQAALAQWRLLDQPQLSIRSLRSNITGAISGYTDAAGLTRGTRSDKSAVLAETTYDPYLDFAGDWAWALFDRAICAHMRGDEALALASTRTLSEVQPRIEAEASRRGFARQRYYDSARRNQEKPYLDFLERLPQFLADLERREHEGIRVPILERGLTNLPSADERIAALIRDLDLVAARQWGQPGGVMLAEDPIIVALIQEGDAAVAPLIDCLARDQRLTRSVSFGRDFFRQRNVIPVTAAARAALQVILQTDFSSAAEWRAYWQRFQGMRIEERWFTLLQDNAAGMGRWLEVADTLTRPDNVVLVPGTGFSYGMPVTSNAPARMRGEWLRSKSQPSVSDLLARRALEINPTNAAGYDLGTACEICLRLALWDTNSAAPVAAKLVSRGRMVTEYSDIGTQRSGADQRLGLHIAKLTLVRERAGEAGALEDYAAWLRMTTPQSLGYSFADCLEPLTVFATNSVMQTLAGELFGNTNSAWGRLPWPFPGRFNLTETGLLQLPAFRQLLVRELSVKTIVGTCEWRPEWVSYQLTNGVNVSGTLNLALAENERPASGARAELRWCDWIALSLAQTKQLPAFNLFAPVEKREEAIKATATWLQSPAANGGAPARR